MVSLQSAKLKPAARVFSSKFDSIDIRIEWNRYWASGTTRMTGLFTNPDYKLELERGSLAKTVDSYGRKVILIGTALGVVVVYETNIPEKQIREPGFSIDYDRRIKALGIFNEDTECDFHTLCLVLGEYDACPDVGQIIDEHLSMKG